MSGTKHSFKIDRQTWALAAQRVSPLQRTAVFAALVQLVISGDLKDPGDPENYVPVVRERAVSPNVALSPDIWIDPNTQEVAEEFNTITTQNRLLRNLAYAVAAQDNQIRLQLLELMRERWQ